MAGLEMHGLVRVANAGGASGGASSSTGSAMDDVALDIDTLFRMVEQPLDQMESTPARDGFLTISRVREPTRNVRPNEYTPHYVPIGPYHSSQRRIAEKRTYLNIFLDAFSSRTGADKKVLLGTLLKKMKELDASSCYSDRFGGMRSESKFLHILLLDGCYLLACFADSPYRPSSPSPNNNVAPEAPKLPTTGGRATGTENATGAAEVPHVDGPTAPDGDVDVKVRDTFYLLENQIPFIVVRTIYELVTGDTPTTPSGRTPTTPSGDTPMTPSGDTPTTPSDVLDMFKACVKKELRGQGYISATAEPPPSDPAHLLHLVRTFFPDRQAEGGHDASSGTGRWRRATEYCRYANVRFHPWNLDHGAASSILDVSLEGGALRVPLLRVDNNTWTILRNLMALEEERHAGSLKRRVTAYCLFMSQLACTEEDVALLVRRRVVEHFLGSDAEVAAGFADLCKGVVLDLDKHDSNYLKPVWHGLERRYRSRWQNHVALFRQTHGRNLLYAAAFAAAVILFASQVLQGIFTVMGYYWK